MLLFGRTRKPYTLVLEARVVAGVEARVVVRMARVHRGRPLQVRGGRCVATKRPVLALVLVVRVSLVLQLLLVAVGDGGVNQGRWVTSTAGSTAAGPASSAARAPRGMRVVAALAALARAAALGALRAL